MLALTVASGAMGWWLHDAPARCGLGNALASQPRPGQSAAARRRGPCGSTPRKSNTRSKSAPTRSSIWWRGCPKRLGAPLHAPQLGAQGYELVGGRLLPGQSGPVAQFMYHDASGARLTLYVSTEQTTNHETGFRFAQEGEVAVFYWIDGKFGYALSGQLPKAALGKIADAVYAQLQPGA